MHSPRASEPTLHLHVGLLTQPDADPTKNGSGKGK